VPPDFPTFADQQRLARDEMLSKNSTLTLEVIEREGSDANAITAGMAAVGDDLTTQMVRAQAGLFLDSARGTTLDRLVFDRYGLSRKPASQALGSVNFTTTTPAPATMPIPRGTVVATSDGRQFVTWADATFPMGSVGPIVVEVRSTLPGSDQQARANTITSIQSQITNQTDDLRVTNPLATAGADDEEEDDQLRARARLFFTTARRGTLKAIEAAALSVPGVRTANVFEGLDALGRPARFVNLVVTDAYTDDLVDIDPTPATYQTQSQVLADSVALALDDVRAGGIYVQIQVAVVVLQPVTLGLRFLAGVSADLVALNARAVLAAYINSLNPGDDMLVSELIARLRTVNGLEVTGAEILSPAGDVVVPPLSVLRSGINLIVATSVQPDRALQGSANPDGLGY
jgi:uncharacterized phage protein gp47/JayE